MLRSVADIGYDLEEPDVVAQQAPLGVQRHLPHGELARLLADRAPYSQPPDQPRDHIQDHRRPLRPCQRVQGHLLPCLHGPAQVRNQQGGDDESLPKGDKLHKLRVGFGTQDTRLPTLGRRLEHGPLFERVIVTEARASQELALCLLPHQEVRGAAKQLQGCPCVFRHARRDPEGIFLEKPCQNQRCQKQRPRDGAEHQLHGGKGQAFKCQREGDYENDGNDPGRGADLHELGDISAHAHVQIGLEAEEGGHEAADGTVRMRWVRGLVVGEEEIVPQRAPHHELVHPRLAQANALEESVTVEKGLFDSQVESPGRSAIRHLLQKTLLHEEGLERFLAVAKCSCPLVPRPLGGDASAHPEHCSGLEEQHHQEQENHHVDHLEGLGQRILGLVQGAH
mmetsp:Transcript_92134/g.297990  ORF Transcript_92134/g.297990 Transcript_92134/m.297990 type:complete len:395 (-) Transcript_92134:561-1745(-)